MDKYELPVTYNGIDLSFQARVIAVSYIQKFEVLVKGRCVIFEPDEEGRYRAVSGQPAIHALEQESSGLLKEIAAVIQYITD